MKDQVIFLQPAVTAADVDHRATSHAGGLQDFQGVFPRVRRRRNKAGWRVAFDSWLFSQTEYVAIERAEVEPAFGCRKTIENRHGG